jgi:hypothetical protein
MHYAQESQLYPLPFFQGCASILEAALKRSLKKLDEPESQYGG